MKLEEYTKLSVAEQNLRKEEILKCLDDWLIDNHHTYDLMFELPKKINGLVLNGEMLVKIIFAIVDSRIGEIDED